MSVRCLLLNESISYFVEVNVTTVDRMVFNTSIDDANSTNATNRYNVTTVTTVTEQRVYMELVQRDTQCRRNCSVVLGIGSIPSNVVSYSAWVYANNIFGLSQPSSFELEGKV